MMGKIPLPQEDYLIAKVICLTQVASDGGKGIAEIRNILPNSGWAWNCGYPEKDNLLLWAIKLINKSHHSMFRYYIVADDEYGDDWIVYFTYRMNRVKWQISFHTFCEKVKKYLPKRGRFHQIWDEKRSRDTAIQLADIVRFPGEYYRLISE